MLDRRLLALLVAVPTFIGAIHAQTPEPPTTAKTPSPRQPQPDAPQPSPGPTVSVEFAGGTAKQFVDAVRHAAGPGKVNVIMPKEAENVALPAISLREVSTYTALQALEYAASPESGNQFAISRLGKGEEPSATFAIRYAGRVIGGYPNVPQAPPPKIETRVFSIRDLIEAPQGQENDPALAASIDTVLNALKTASQLEADAKVSPPDLMLHKDSMLLIVRGTIDQHKTIESVLTQLTQSIVSRRARAMEAAQRARASAIEQAEFKAQLDMSRAQLDATSAEVGNATKNVERIKQLVNTNQASQVEFQNAESMLNTARGIQAQAAAHRRGLEERAAIIQARAEAGGDAGPGEAPVAVVYDCRDLEAFEDDLFGLARSVVFLDRAAGNDAVSSRGKGTMVIKATPSQHHVLVRALNAMRRAKANEPKLPGLDAENLIRKGEGR